MKLNFLPSICELFSITECIVYIKCFSTKRTSRRNQPTLFNTDLSYFIITSATLNFEKNIWRDSFFVCKAKFVFPLQKVLLLITLWIWKFDHVSHLLYLFSQESWTYCLCLMLLLYNRFLLQKVYILYIVSLNLGFTSLIRKFCAFSYSLIRNFTVKLSCCALPQIKYVKQAIRFFTGRFFPWT